jgi:hypothetical protein
MAVRMFPAFAPINKHFFIFTALRIESANYFNTTATPCVFKGPTTKCSLQGQLK